MKNTDQKENKLANFYKKNKIVLIWGLVSLVAAVAIHFAFYFPAKYEWLVHQWGAGDILTYISTVALGLLAIWQNQKFKEENDKAQEIMEQQNSAAQARLERINIEANELSVISRIINYEDEYLARVEETAHRFLNSSSTSVILRAIKQAIDNNDPTTVSGAYTEMEHTYDRIRATYLLGLKTDGKELLILMEAFGDLYEKASTIFTNIYKEQKYDFDFVNDYSIIFDKAENALEVFLYERRKLVYRVLTERMTIDQVRSIYSVIEGNIDRYNN